MQRLLTYPACKIVVDLIERLDRISTVSDPSGSGRVDMLTLSVALARAAVATGAWVKSKHDMYLIRGSVGA